MGSRVDTACPARLAVARGAHGASVSRRHANSNFLGTQPSRQPAYGTRTNNEYVGVGLVVVVGGGGLCVWGGGGGGGGGDGLGDNAPNLAAFKRAARNRTAVVGTSAACGAPITAMCALKRSAT